MFGYAFDPQPSGQALPAYYSALGPGFRRAVKPDVTLPGGRQLVERFPGVQPSEIRPRGTTRPPGHRVAYPPKAQMSFSTTAHTRGTSNASALATRSVGLLVAELEDSTDSPFAGLPRETLALLTKTLIAHGTSQGEMHDVLQSRLSDLLALNRRSAAQYLGYGALDLSRVLRCTDERATMIGFGELKKDRGHRFRVPLPPSLAGRREWRRLTVTLAWWTPIQSSHQKYRKAALWFEPYGEQVAQPRIDSEGRTKSKNVPMDDFDAKTRLQVKRKQFDHQQVRNGTVQHEIFEGEKASAFLDGDEVHLQVNCRVEAGRLLGPAPYALAVTLEVAEGVGIPIYEEIRARLPVPVRVTA